MNRAFASTLQRDSHRPPARLSANVTATARHRSTRMTLRIADLMLDCVCLLLATTDGGSGITVSSLAELAAAFAEGRDARPFAAPLWSQARTAQARRAGPTPSSGMADEGAGKRARPAQAKQSRGARR